MNKPTKDQRRAKAKREEQKRRRTKAHEANINSKPLFNFAAVLAKTLDGSATVIELERSLLKVVGGTRPVKRPDLFEHPIWLELKQRMCAFVAILRDAPDKIERVLPMLGRVYFIESEEFKYDVESLPHSVRNYEKWHPNEVVQQLSKVKPRAQEGMYCYGIEMGHITLHFASVTIQGVAGYTEQYLVTPDDWIYLCTEKFDKFLYPLVCEPQALQRTHVELQASECLGLDLPNSKLDSPQFYSRSLDAETSKLIHSATQPYIEECDWLLESIHRYQQSHSDKTFEMGKKFGYAQGMASLKDIKAEMIDLHEQEVRRRLAVEASKAARKAASDGMHSVQATPLHARMAKIFEITAT